jgi:uncharacterized protein YhhL (DUF1145 family)
MSPPKSRRFSEPTASIGLSGTSDRTNALRSGITVGGTVGGMPGWGDFAVITGGSSAALVGLLFVAVSIRADHVGESRALRSRLAQILTIFLGVLMASIAIALPNPAGWVLGVELIVVSLMMGAALIVLNGRAERADSVSSLEGVLARINPNFTTAVLMCLGGLCLAFGLPEGLFLIAVAALVAFVGGVIGAWLVLVRPGD